MHSPTPQYGSLDEQFDRVAMITRTSITRAFLAAAVRSSRELLQVSGSARRERLHTVRRAEQHDVGTAACEQTDGHDAWNRVDPVLELDGIADLQVGHIENDVAVVGGESHPPRRLPYELHEL